MLLATMKNTPFAVWLIFLFVTYLVTKCDSRQFLSWGIDKDYEIINTTSREVREIAELGLEYFVTHHNVENPPQSITDVIKAERQRVNSMPLLSFSYFNFGYNYKIQFIAKNVENGRPFENWSCQAIAYQSLNGKIEIKPSTTCIFTSLQENDKRMIVRFLKTAGRIEKKEIIVDQE